MNLARRVLAISAGSLVFVGLVAASMLAASLMPASPAQLGMLAKGSPCVMDAFKSLVERDQVMTLGEVDYVTSACSGGRGQRQPIWVGAPFGGQSLAREQALAVLAADL